ncbi:MAG: segregation and condensation protein B [Parcubacteria group bacterium Athens0714_16]|nr:MAG: segregation and condensation protein B [Parcubacteria group bacterium Athens0714_16]
MNLDAKIESILFYKGEPVSIKELGKILDVSVWEINKSLKILEEKLKDRGLKLISTDNDVMLGTTPEMSALIDELRKEELSKNLGRASLETLTIVLYKGPISKPDIDYIRGVNSATILRSLLVRGLIERAESAENKRTYLYSPTIDLISYLGIENVRELPEYGKIKESIEEFEKTFKQAEDEEIDTSKANFENIE